MIHELKCWPAPFDDIVSGIKTFEIRKNDRDFKVGDFLHLRRWDLAVGYSGKECMRSVCYLVSGPDWDLPDGLCVMGLKGS